MLERDRDVPTPVGAQDGGTGAAELLEEVRVWMAVRVGLAHADHGEAFVHGLEERKDRRVGPVMGDVKHFGSDRFRPVQHLLLGVGLRLVGEQHRVLEMAHHEHERVVVGVGVRSVPALVGAEHVERKVANREGVARRRVSFRDALFPDGVQEVAVRRRRALRKGAPRIEHHSHREPSQHRRQAHIVVEVRMGRHHDVQALYPEGGQLGGHELGIGAAVEQDRGPSRRPDQGGVAGTHDNDGDSAPSDKAN